MSDAPASAELTAEGDVTILDVAVSGLPLEMLYAFGAGWHTHLEGLGTYLARRPIGDRPTNWSARWANWRPCIAR